MCKHKLRPPLIMPLELSSKVPLTLTSTYLCLPGCKPLTPYSRLPPRTTHPCPFKSHYWLFPSAWWETSLPCSSWGSCVSHHQLTGLKLHLSATKRVLQKVVSWNLLQSTSRTVNDLNCSWIAQVWLRWVSFVPGSSRKWARKHNWKLSSQTSQA